MKKKVILSLVFFLIANLSVWGEESSCITQGTVWIDTEGNQINAHGGGVLYANGKYYWYGENRPAKGFMRSADVNCYSSTDLLNWKNEGLVLSVSHTPGHDIESGCIIERPKVIYNKNTGKYVMWFHLELKGQGYGPARAAVAVSDTPVGSFEFVRSGRVNPGKYPLNIKEEQKQATFKPGMKDWTPEWVEAVKAGMFTLRDLDGGQMSRDMTVFVDDDDKAYHIYSSEENCTLQIAELTDDYLDHTGRYIRIFESGLNEAPAVFKHNGRYWMITSGCTGWAPNDARLMTATDIMGEWKQLPNPCVGSEAEKTFGGQSHHVLPVQGKDGAFIAMFDRWNPGNLFDSRYVWLPVEFDSYGTPVLNWVEKWNPSTKWTTEAE